MKNFLPLPLCTVFWVCTGPGKPGKSWKFFFDIFQDFPVVEKDYSSWNVLKICLTQAIKFSEFMPVMYLDHWENLV